MDAEVAVIVAKKAVPTLLPVPTCVVVENEEVVLVLVFVFVFVLVLVLDETPVAVPFSVVAPGFS